jgi:hypothetical protein
LKAAALDANRPGGGEAIDQIKHRIQGRFFAEIRRAVSFTFRRF